MTTRTGILSGLSESYLADLGRVVAAWSQVETKFQILFLSMVVMRGASSGRLNTPRVRDLMGLSLGRQLDQFRLRLDELNCSGNVRKKYERIFSQLDTLRGERDQVAHSVWQPSAENGLDFPPDKGVALYKSWKNQKEATFKTVTQPRLQEICRRMEVLYWDLVRLQLEKHQDFPPVPPT